MNTLFRSSLTLATLLVAAQASAQVTLYAAEAFRGQSFRAEQTVGNLEREGFNDRASSVVVESGAWEVCEDAFFRGRCVVLRPGRYASLATAGLNERISSMRRADAAAYDGQRPVPAVPAEITLYDREGFAGRSLIANDTLANLEREGFNDRASSSVVTGG